jgi:type II secretory pathway component PulK
MKNTSTFFGIGMLGLGSLIAYATYPTLSAHFAEKDVAFGQVQLQELTEEKKAEIQAQHKEKLATELAEGRITQEQYDTMLTQLETFTFPMMRGKGRALGFSGEVAFSGMRPDFSGAKVDFSGFNLHFGKERAELTEEEKAARAAQQAERKLQMQEKLTQALAEGSITQEQYDAMLARGEKEMPTMKGRGDLSRMKRIGLSGEIATVE